jgi:hypothetical protein
MENEILITALSSEALTYPAKAKEIKIRDQVSLDVANAFLRGVKGLLGKIAETFDPIIKQAHEAHRQAIEQKKKHEEPLLQAERIIKTEMGRYLTEQARIRQEAEEKARRETAEAERKRLAEMQAAIDAENAGKPEEAEKHFEEAIAIEPPKPVIPEPVKAQGTFLRKELKWRVFDLNLVPREFLVLDRQKVEQVFRIQREKMSIPGVETYEDPIVVSRSS